VGSPAVVNFGVDEVLDGRRANDLDVGLVTRVSGIVGIDHCGVSLAGWWRLGAGRGLLTDAETVDELWCKQDGSERE